jgi:signal transduction histidine kinase/ActR/RegA family two-component response regulator
MAHTLNFEALINASPYPYLVVAVDWTIVAANPAYLNSVKRSASDVVGRQLFDAFPPNPADPGSTNDDIVRGSIETAIATGKAHTTALLKYAVPVKSDTGTAYEPRYWSTVHTPVFGLSGAVEFVIQNAIDVTALYAVDASGKAPSLKTEPMRETQDVLQAQTHQAMMRILNAERSHLLGLFNQAPGFIAVLRGPYHVFELVNEAYYQLLGHREIVGKPLREAIPDVMGQGFEELLDSVYTTGQPFVGRGIRFEAQRTAGGPFVELYIDLLYQPFFDADGAVVGIFAQGQDVTEIYQANRALKEADRRKDDFLAMLAHELRNPLAPISSAAELLPLVAGNANRVRATAETIGKQVRHLARLVEDLLDVSRVTSGMVEIERSQVNALDVLLDAEEQVRPHFEKRGQRLELQHPARPLYISGDQDRLVQVVTNLLHNASKYSPPSETIAATISQSGAGVQIVIEDNGIGIESDFLPHVFELFAQGKRSSARSEGGLGLGLSLVKSLVELHGGTVHANSKGAHRGSRFTVTLPELIVDIAPVAPKPAPQMPAQSTAALRVLVVDDNVDAAEVMADFVQAFAHIVDTVHDAQKAFALAEKTAFDACLLDIGLPGGMDGNELARRLRMLPTTRDALLVAVTGYGHANDRVKGMEAGFDHYFVKPVDLSKIVELCGEHAAR